MDSSPESFDDLLDPGEKLLWSGQPKQGFLFQISDYYTIPFSLVWMGFAMTPMLALSIGMANAKEKSRYYLTPGILVALLFILPFFLAGIHIVAGRFFLDAAVRRKTFYLLTDRRVIVQKNYFGRQTVSLELTLLPAITLHEWKDNSGDIIFGTPTSMWAVIFKSNWNGKTWSALPGFYLVRDARQVHAKIRAAQAEARRRPLV